MKKHLLKIINNKYIYFILIFILFLIIHSHFNLMNDDISFSKILDTTSILDYTKTRYLTWTSRVIIELFLINISRSVIIWRITNCLVILLLIYAIEKLSFEKISLKNTLLITQLYLLYPYYQMAEAGFAATTLNYLWPLAFLLYAFIPFQYIYQDKKLNKKYVLFNILAYIFACNQEQAACIGLSVTLIFLIYCIKNKKNKIYPIILLIISSLSIIFILTCPGNAIRTAIEITNCYPDYINANFFDKVFLSVVSTCSILISNYIVLLIFSILLFLVTKKQKQQSRIISIISFIQLMIITAISIYRTYIVFISSSFLDSYTYGIFYFKTDIGHIFTLSINNILLFSLCIGMVICYCIQLYNIFKEKSYISILILLIGCGSRVMIGFSPTIFESGNRTMIFLYFSLLFIILLLWNKYKKSLSKKKIIIFNTIIIVFIIINYILTFKAIPLIKNI